jgi:hypothetical protein
MGVSINVMKKFFLEDFGNPGSHSHEYGDIPAKGWVSILAFDP